MKKFVFLLCMTLLIGIGQSMGQFVRPVTLTLSGRDTTKNGAAKTYNYTLKDAYYWSVQVYYDKLTGSGDTARYLLEESNDGVHYTTVVGSVAPTFHADGSYIWSGGTGTLPLIWCSTYLRVDQSYTTTCTNTAKPTVILNLKPK